MADSRRSKSKLQQVREDVGLSREKVVRRLEPPISTKTLERWERGASPVKGYLLRQLAAIYGVSLADLLENEEATA